MRYNCARVYVGGYVGGRTNENERWIECNYQLIKGHILLLSTLFPIVGEILDY